MKKYLALVLLLNLVFIGGCKKKQRPEETNAQEKNSVAEEIPSKVEMTTVAQKHVGLETTPATMAQLKEYLRVTGTVQPMDSRISEVAPLARGRVVRLPIQVGDRVSKGATLVVLDNLEAADLLAQEQSAQAALRQMGARLVPLTRQTERSQRLAEIGAGATKDYESSKAEEQALKESIRSQESLLKGLQQRLRGYGVPSASNGALSALRAPFSGVVTQAQLSLGDVVEAGKAVITVADLSHVWVQAEVYEKDLGRIRIGQDAIIHVDTYSDESFTGRITYISDVLDPQTRTARVRCEVPNKDGRLKANMFANIELPTTFSKQALAVPSSAFQEVEGKSVVFVQTGPTSFALRPVEKGVTVNGLSEIVRGVRAGDRVVTQGAFHLKSILAGSELGEE